MYFEYFEQLFTILNLCRNVSYSAGLVFFTTELQLRVGSCWLRVEPRSGVSSLILADQLTLFQPGGTDYAHLITTGTQTMTEAKHNRPIPKLFDNRPSASATEVFCETIGLVIYIQNIPKIVSFSLLLS